MRAIGKPLPQPDAYVRLLANWGLSLSGAACLLPAEEPLCPLRPLLEAGRRLVGGGDGR